MVSEQKNPKASLFKKKKNKTVSLTGYTRKCAKNNPPIFPFCLFGGGGGNTCHGAPRGGQKAIFNSFHHVGPRDGAQVSRVGSLYPLSCSASPAPTLDRMSTSNTKGRGGANLVPC